MADGIFEVLKAEHIDVVFGGLDDLDGERGVGIIAVAQDKVMLVVAPHRVVGNGTRIRRLGARPAQTYRKTAGEKAPAPG